MNNHATSPIYIFICLLINRTGATSEAGVTNPSEAAELTLVFVGFMLLQI